MSKKPLAMFHVTSFLETRVQENNKKLMLKQAQDIHNVIKTAYIARGYIHLVKSKMKHFKLHVRILY